MKHLTFSYLLHIEFLLEKGKNFSQIVSELSKCPTTISKEVFRHRSVIRHYSTETAKSVLNVNIYFLFGEMSL